jgi:integrase
MGRLADTGCRRTEVASVKLSDIDADRQVVTVIGKGDKQREVRYSNRTAVALDRYLRVRQKNSKAASPMLWLGLNGGLSSDGVAEVVARRSERAGVYRVIDGKRRPINPHSFRHAFADRWLTSGGNEGDLMVLGGWSDSATMRRYGRGRQTDRALEAAARMFGEPA